MKSATLAIAALTLTAAVPALAQTQVQSGTYKVEPAHTQVLFGVSHLGFTTYYGVFSGASGSLTLDSANPAASKLDVSVPTASVWTPSDKLNEELKGPQWLDAAKYPAMTFHSTAVTPTGATTADVAGELTLHGVTKPVTLKVKFNSAGPNPLTKAYTTGFQVSGVVKRSDFGVSMYVPMVGDDVDLTISAAFEKAGG
jgi:polyisoprenoid-binding protein YceI